MDEPKSTPVEDKPVNLRAAFLVSREPNFRARRRKGELTVGLPPHEVAPGRRGVDPADRRCIGRLSKDAGADGHPDHWTCSLDSLDVSKPWYPACDSEVVDTKDLDEFVSALTPPTGEEHSRRQSAPGSRVGPWPASELLTRQQHQLQHRAFQLVGIPNPAGVAGQDSADKWDTNGGRCAAGLDESKRLGERLSGEPGVVSVNG